MLNTIYVYTLYYGLYEPQRTLKVRFFMLFFRKTDDARKKAEPINSIRLLLLGYVVESRGFFTL